MNHQITLFRTSVTALWEVFFFGSMTKENELSQDIQNNFLPILEQWRTKKIQKTCTTEDDKILQEKLSEFSGKIPDCNPMFDAIICLQGFFRTGKLIISE